MSIGGVVIQFSAETKRAKREIDKLTRSLQGVDSTATAANKRRGGLLGGAAAAKMAGGTAAVAAALAVIGAKSVSVAADFETSQNVLQANLGATAAEMNKLADLAKKMGASTVFSAQDASDAMLELAKAGLSTSQIMGGGVQAAMALAATEGMDLAAAAVATSNAMNMFGLSASDLPAVADAFAGAAKASTASVESLTQGLAQVGPGAKSAGLSLQDTVGILAAFDNMGMKGSDAGTSLKTMLNRLVPQTDKAKNAFKKYGLAVYDSEKAMAALKEMGIATKGSGIDDVTDALLRFYKAQGMSQVEAAKAADGFLWAEGFQNQLTNLDGSFKAPAQWAKALKDALGGLSEADLTEATNLLFGSDAGRAGGIFAQLGTEGLQPFIDGAGQAGVAAEMADARTKGFKGATEELTGSLETLGITMGTTVLPKLTEFVNFINNEVMPAIQRFAEGGETFDQFGRALALVAQWVTTWVGLVAGNFRLLLNVIYLFGKGVLAILSSIPIIGSKFAEAEDTLDAQFGAASSWLDGVETSLAEARTAIDQYIAKVDEIPKSWGGGFTYYDPRTGEMTKSGGKKKSKSRSGDGKNARTVNVTINNPTPTKAEDSAALALRLTRTVGVA